MVWNLLEKHKSKFVVNTVLADGLTPLAARPSAGTVMTKAINLINMTYEMFTYFYMLHKPQSNNCYTIYPCQKWRIFQ